MNSRNWKWAFSAALFVKIFWFKFTEENEEAELTPLTRWTFLPISLFSFSPLSAFLLGSDTVYRRQCPFEWQGERKKQILLKCRPKRFFLRPCDRPKNEPVIFNGETNKIQNRRRLFFFYDFSKEWGIFSVWKFCCGVLSIICLFVCGPRWEERINRRGLKNRPSSWMVDAVCCHMVAEGMTRFFKSIWIWFKLYFKIENHNK